MTFWSIIRSASGAPAVSAAGCPSSPVAVTESVACAADAGTSITATAATAATKILLPCMLPPGVRLKPHILLLHRTLQGPTGRVKVQRRVPVLVDPIHR